jgi:hypothetical protein
MGPYICAIEAAEVAAWPRLAWFDGVVGFVQNPFSFEGLGDIGI